MKAVQQPSETWTIVQDVGVYTDYPRIALAAEVEELFNALSVNFPPNIRKTVGRLLTLLECYLQVTSQTLDLTKLFSEKFTPLARGFIGALESYRFFIATRETRYNYRIAFRRIIVECARTRATSYTPEAPTTLHALTLTDGICIKQFDEMQLCQNRVWIWQGWKVENLNGGVSWLRLEPLTKYFDRDFVDEFYAVCQIYYSTGRAGNANYINRIAKFTASYPGVSRKILLDEEYATTFWYDFYNYYLNEELKTCKVATIVTTWYRQIKTFAEKHLFVSGLFGKPRVFPTPPRLPVIGNALHLGVGPNGKIHVEKLLTHVPVHLSHSEAIDILFRRLQRDVDWILTWANAEAEIIWNAFRQRIAWEKEGMVRRLSSPGANQTVSHINDRNNPEHLKNAAATIASHYKGYGTRESYPRMIQVLPAGLPQLARELGFPVTNSLLPHMTILVHEHPEITPAFLEKLEIFDSNGKLKGLIIDDSGHTLKSVKMRKGRQLAEQHVLLTPRAAEIVLQIVEITAAPRQYMRDQKNSDWRYLFLTTGVGFGAPTRVSKIDTCTSAPIRTNALAAQIERHNSVDRDEAADLALRFSLPALRASMGVLEYVRTHSGAKMAAKLGHAQYNERLLARYLPSAIKAFLQSRYIRIMQTGIIVEAMKESPHLLEAATLSSEEELSAFLNNHALYFSSNRPPEHLIRTDSDAELDESPSTEKIIFNVNEDVLTIYASLEKAFNEHPELVSSIARYWNQIGIRLMAFIEEKKDADPTLFEMLNLARARADYCYIQDIFNE